MQYDLDKPFNPSSVENGLYEKWESSDVFEPSGNGESYSIAIPPPNITGTLHLGHAFQVTLMDTMIRYRRMSGFNTLWQVGTDHAGISTQMVVSEDLRAKGINIIDLGRERFVERVWDWRTQFGGTITNQLRRMGASVDWNRERFTLDEGFSRTVTEVFVRLYEDGLIYKAKRLVNWDPQLETAVSDLEVLTEERDGKLWHLRYPLAEGSTQASGESYLVVATTRPETMLGDTGVAVNPNDDRYKDLIGSFVTLPLVGRKLPIVGDEHVDQEFGTGCLKITPAHDFDDYEIGQRHGLDLIDIFTSKAELNENVPDRYQGLDRFEGRKRVLTDLEAAGLLHATEDYRNQIPVGERSGAVIEPRMTEQWFVDIKPLAEPAIDAVKTGAIRFQPKEWENVYYAWMNDIRDWTISRQQWWGHRIPAWYTEDKKIVVGRDEAEARRKNGIANDIELVQDPDVLETWFSSALWTFGTLGWPDQTQELETFHPTDVLVTGHDIIFFWVARMIMMTLKFTGEIPFKNVYITGLIYDAHGQKMSKTKGNGLDPLDVIDGISLDALVEKRTSHLTQPRMADRIARQTQKDFPNGIASFGTDALRMTFATLASPTRTYNFDLKQVEGSKNFCNKIWNAARYVLSHVPEELPKISQENQSLADRWIRTQTQQLVKSIHGAIESYRFDLYAKTLYATIWGEYCDWYVEFSKIPLWDEHSTSSERSATQRTLVEVLETLLRLTHPIMPYITEALWLEVKSHLYILDQTLLTADFPRVDETQIDEEAFEAIEWLKKFITALRTIRGERQIPPKQQIPVTLIGGTQRDKEHVELCSKYVQKLANVSDITWLSDSGDAPLGSLEVLADLKIVVPFLGQDEMDLEVTRLNKEIERLSTTLKQAEGKLANENFVARAPRDVVSKEREKLASTTTELQTLKEQLAELAAPIG